MKTSTFEVPTDYQLLTVDEAAKIICIERNAIKDLIQHGILQARGRVRKDNAKYQPASKILARDVFLFLDKVFDEKFPHNFKDQDKKEVVVKSFFNNQSK